MAGAIAIALACKSLRPRRSAASKLAASTARVDPGRWTRAAGRAALEAELGEDLRRSDGNSRVGQDREERRRIERGTEPLAQTRHDARARRQARRDVRADGARRRPETIIVGGEAVFMGERAQRRRRVRRAAAQPRRDRQGLAQMEARRSASRARVRPSARAARNTRLSSSGPAAGAGRPVDDERQRRAGLEAQPVAAAGEGDDAVELVPPVGAPPEDVQGQIDLCGRPPEPRRRRRRGQSLAAALLVGSGGRRAPSLLGSSGKPNSIFLRMLGRSSGSGCMSRAWFHWKRASILRFTRQ